MRITNLDWSVVKPAHWALALLGMAALASGVPFGGVFSIGALVVAIVTLLVGLAGWTSEMAAAQASGDIAKIAQCRGDLHLYELGCLIVILGAFAVVLIPLFMLVHPGPSKQAKALNNSLAQPSALKSDSSRDATRFRVTVSSPVR